MERLIDAKPNARQKAHLLDDDELDELEHITVGDVERRLKAKAEKKGSRK